MIGHLDLTEVFAGLHSLGQAGQRAIKAAQVASYLGLQAGQRVVQLDFSFGAGEEIPLKDEDSLLDGLQRVTVEDCLQPLHPLNI